VPRLNPQTWSCCGPSSTSTPQLIREIERRKRLFRLTPAERLLCRGGVALERVAVQFFRRAVRM
jgi:hypothetical protein